MDNRFPKYVHTLVKRLSFLSIPNLGMLLAGFGVLGFIGYMSGTVPMGRFVFHPQLFIEGEWWRILTFPVAEAPTGPLMLLFYVFFVYYVMNHMEQDWGVAPLTIFVLFAYLAGIAGSFYLWSASGIWRSVLDNVLFAYGTLYPEQTFHLFGVFPVKAKWLALFYAALKIPMIISAPIFSALTFFPYIFFFGPVLFNLVASSQRTRQRRQKYDEDMWK